MKILGFRLEYVIILILLLTSFWFALDVSSNLYSMAAEAVSDFFGFMVLGV